MRMLSLFAVFLRRDARLSFLRGSEGAAALFFFAVVVSLFPFAFGASPEMLKTAAPGIIWVAALLSMLIALESVYHRDHADGTLDLLLLSPVPRFSIVLAKMLSHWLLCGVPLLCASLLAAPMLHLPLSFLPVLLAGLGLGTFYMALLGGFGAVLTLSSRRPGILLALLVFPLYIPMLILGMLAATSALAGMPAKPYLLLQLALAVGGLPLLPWASAAFLNLHLRSS